MTPSTSPTGRRTRRAGGRPTRAAQALAVAAATLLGVSACSSSEPSSQEAPQEQWPQEENISHGPFFPECGGISDQTVSELTRVTGLVNTARTSVGCQWLVNGSIMGPHFSFTWFRGSPIGRERKTQELSRASVEDIDIEGHSGFLAIGEDPFTRTKTLCEVGIQFDDDFIEWSVSYVQQPFPDPCEVATELTRQSIANSK